VAVLEVRGWRGQGVLTGCGGAAVGYKPDGLHCGTFAIWLLWEYANIADSDENKGKCTQSGEELSATPSIILSKAPLIMLILPI
jgi:hypothetical protein